MSTVQQSNDDLLLELENVDANLTTLNTNVAKESKQDTIITSLGSIDTELGTLNTNGAKEAKQDTIITALNSIDTNTSGLANGDTGAGSTVAVSVTSVTLVAANSVRVEAIIRNDTNNNLYIAHGGTATLSSAIKLKKGDVFIEDNYTGVISGIWDSASGGGNAQITEVDVA